VDKITQHVPNFGFDSIFYLIIIYLLCIFHVCILIVPLSTGLRSCDKTFIIFILDKRNSTAFVLGLLMSMTRKRERR